MTKRPDPDDVLDPGVAEAYRERLARNRPEDRSGCTPAELIEALVREQGEGATRMADLDHVMSCGLCREDYELLRAIADAEAGTHAETELEVGSGAAAGAGPLAREGRRRAYPAWVPVALAASVIGVIGVGVLARDGGRDPVLRGGAAAVELRVPTGTVDAEGVDRLVWTSVDGDATYEVQLLGDDGAVLYSATTPDTVLMLPEGLELPVGQALSVVVASTTMADGRRLHPASAFRTR